MRRLLRAVHFAHEAFSQLEVQSAAKHEILSEKVLALPVGKVPLIQCVARQIRAPPKLTFRLNALSEVGSRDDALKKLCAVIGKSDTVAPHPTWPDAIMVDATPRAQ